MITHNEEAPSPAPAPTEESIVIKAISLHDDFKINQTSNTIEIRIMNSFGHYSITIHNNDDLWNSFKHYFQNDFNIFSNIVFQTLVQKIDNGVKYTIIKEDFDEIIVKLDYQSLFSFSIQITLENELHKIKLLQDRIIELEKQNKEILMNKTQKNKKNQLLTQGWTIIQKTDAFPHENAPDLPPYKGGNPVSIHNEVSVINQIKLSEVFKTKQYGGFVYFQLQQNQNTGSLYFRDKSSEACIKNLTKISSDKYIKLNAGASSAFICDFYIPPGSNKDLLIQKEKEGFDIIWDEADKPSYTQEWIKIHNADSLPGTDPSIDYETNDVFDAIKYSEQNAYTGFCLTNRAWWRNQSQIDLIKNLQKGNSCSFYISPGVPIHYIERKKKEGFKIETVYMDTSLNSSPDDY